MEVGVFYLKPPDIPGVYLIANEKLVWHHLEKEWGDAANIDEVREAIRKFK